MTKILVTIHGDQGDVVARCGAAVAGAINGATDKCLKKADVCFETRTQATYPSSEEARAEQSLLAAMRPEVTPKDMRS